MGPNENYMVMQSLIYEAELINEVLKIHIIFWKLPYDKLELVTMKNDTCDVEK